MDTAAPASPLPPLEEALSLVELQSLKRRRALALEAVDRLVEALGPLVRGLVSQEVADVYSALNSTPADSWSSESVMPPEAHAERLERLHAALVEWAAARGEAVQGVACPARRLELAEKRLATLARHALPALRCAQLEAQQQSRPRESRAREEALTQALARECERRKVEVKLARDAAMDYAARVLGPTLVGRTVEGARRLLEDAPESLPQGMVCEDAAQLGQDSSDVWAYMLNHECRPDYHTAFTALSRLQRTAQGALALRTLAPAMARCLHFLDVAQQRLSAAGDATAAKGCAFYAALLGEAFAGHVGSPYTSPAETWLLESLRLDDARHQDANPGLPKQESISSPLQAARAYLRVVRALAWLEGAASGFTSRRDNNGVFEVRWWLRDVAGRILRGYEGKEERPVPRTVRGCGTDAWLRQGEAREAARWRVGLLSLPDVSQACMPELEDHREMDGRTYLLLKVGEAFQALHAKHTLAAGNANQVASEAIPGDGRSKR